MNNYYDLIKEIVLTRLNISKSDFRGITDIKFRDDGVCVYYEYWWGRNDVLTGNDIIYNSEINAFIFEQSFNK